MLPDLFDDAPARQLLTVHGPSNASWSRIYGWMMPGQALWAMTTVYRDGRITMRLESKCSLVVRE